MLEKKNILLITSSKTDYMIEKQHIVLFIIKSRLLFYVLFSIHHHHHHHHRRRHPDDSKGGKRVRYMYDKSIHYKTSNLINICTHNFNLLHHHRHHLHTPRFHSHNHHLHPLLPLVLQHLKHFLRIFQLPFARSFLSEHN